MLGAELLTRTRVFAPYESIADVSAKLLGRAWLPWEDPSMSDSSGSSLLRDLRALKRSVLACLNRSAAGRPRAHEVLGKWNGLLDAETATRSRHVARSDSSSTTRGSGTHDVRADSMRSGGGVDDSAAQPHASVIAGAFPELYRRNSSLTDVTRRSQATDTVSDGAGATASNNGAEEHRGASAAAYNIDTQLTVPPFEVVSGGGAQVPEAIREEDADGPDD